MLRWILVAVVIAVSAWSIVTGHTVRTPGVANAGDHAGQHLRAVYSPLHFKPAIESATDAQCLVCHKEVLEDKVRAVSPAGVKAADSLAWYQQVSTYQGEQDTFHRRHLVTPMAKQLMNLSAIPATKATTRARKRRAHRPPWRHRRRRTTPASRCASRSIPRPAASNATAR